MAQQRPQKRRKAAPDPGGMGDFEVGRPAQEIEEQGVEVARLHRRLHAPIGQELGLLAAQEAFGEQRLRGGRIEADAHDHRFLETLAAGAHPLSQARGNRRGGCGTRVGNFARLARFRCFGFRFRFSGGAQQSREGFEQASRHRLERGALQGALSCQGPAEFERVGYGKVRQLRNERMAVAKTPQARVENDGPFVDRAQAGDVAVNRAPHHADLSGQSLRAETFLALQGCVDPVQALECCARQVHRFPLAMGRGKSFHRSGRVGNQDSPAF